MDPQQTNQFAGMIAGMMGMFLLVGLVFTAFFIFLFWRILTKAGLSGPLALLILIPGIGYIIVLCILAFSDWQVVPAPPQYGYAPPPSSYPPPPPPPAYPPAPPPQL
jgi:uncharacterized membrane protein YhaH (DUF805 family)